MTRLALGTRAGLSLTAALVSSLWLTMSCGGDSFVSTPTPNGGSAGSAGAAGGSGVGGNGARSGSGGGHAGSAGKSGSAGQGGSSAGQGGSAGQSGNAGQGGSAGQGGNAGQSGNAGSAGQAGSGGTGGVACKYSATANPCPTGQYCQAPGCVDGTCVPVIVVETSQRAPVCGCDGLTYWNPSLAGEVGMSVMSSGACAMGATCGGFTAQQCPMSASCNYVLTGKDQCGGADLSGSCWVMPKACPVVTGFGPQNRACNATSCMEECDLIKAEGPWYKDGGCPQ